MRSVCLTKPTGVTKNLELELSTTIVRQQNLVVYARRLTHLIVTVRTHGGPRELRAQADEKEQRAKLMKDANLVQQATQLRDIAQELELEGVVSDNPTTADDEKLKSLVTLEEQAEQAQARADHLNFVIETLRERLKSNSVLTPTGASKSRQGSASPQPSPRVKLERDYQFRTISSLGLNTYILVFPNGSELKINFPNDIAIGDTFSGTVQTEVTGKDEKLRARNQAEIVKSVLLLGGQPIHATEKIFTRTISPQFNANDSFVVLKVKGKEVVSVQLSVSQIPAPPPTHTQLPTCGQMRRNIMVMNHGDGIIAPTDSASIGETQLQTFAESTRMRVMKNTSQVAGLTEFKYSEQGRQVSSPFLNLGVALTSPDTKLQTGGKTSMKVIVSAPGIQQDISLELVNDTPGIITISGGDKQRFIIHPADVQVDGTYKQIFTVTAHSAGAWGATATVSCVGQ